MTEIRRKQNAEPDAPRPASGPKPTPAPAEAAPVREADGQVRSTEGAKALERIMGPAPALAFSKQRALGQLGKGIWHAAKETVQGIWQHPIATVATLAVAVAVVAAAPVAGPVILGVAAAGFALAGAWKIGKGAAHAVARYRAGDAAQAEAAFEEIGRGVFDVATSIAPGGAAKAGKVAEATTSATKLVESTALARRAVRTSQLGPLKQVAAPVRQAPWHVSVPAYTNTVAAAFEGHLATARAGGRVDAEILALLERMAAHDVKGRAEASMALKAVNSGAKSAARALLDPALRHAAGRAEIPAEELARLALRHAAPEGALRAAELAKVGQADAADAAFLQALASATPAPGVSTEWLAERLEKLLSGNLGEQREAIGGLRAAFPELAGRAPRGSLALSPVQARRAEALADCGLSPAARDVALRELVGAEGPEDLGKVVKAINRTLWGTNEQVIRVGERLVAGSPAAVRDRLRLVLPREQEAALEVELQLSAGEDLNAVLFELEKAHGHGNQALQEVLDELRLLEGRVQSGHGEVVRLGQRMVPMSLDALEARLKQVMPAEEARALRKELEGGADFAKVYERFTRATSPPVAAAWEELRKTAFAARDAGLRVVSEARLAELEKLGRLDATQRKALAALLDHPAGFQQTMAEDLATFARTQESLGRTMHRMMEGVIGRLPAELRPVYVEAVGREAIAARELTADELALLQQLGAADPQVLELIGDHIAELADGTWPAWKAFQHSAVKVAADKLGLGPACGRARAESLLRHARREVELLDAKGAMPRGDGAFLAALELPEDPARLAAAQQELFHAAAGWGADQREAVTRLRELFPDVSGRYKAVPLGLPTDAGGQAIRARVADAGLSPAAAEQVLQHMAYEHRQVLTGGRLDVGALTGKVNRGLAGTSERVVRVGGTLARADLDAFEARLAELHPRIGADEVRRKLEGGTPVAQVLQALEAEWGQQAGVRELAQEFANGLGNARIEQIEARIAATGLPPEARAAAARQVRLEPDAPDPQLLKLINAGLEGRVERVFQVGDRLAAANPQEVLAPLRPYMPDLEALAADLAAGEDVAGVLAYIDETYAGSEVSAALNQVRGCLGLPEVPPAPAVAAAEARLAHLPLETETRTRLLKVVTRHGDRKPLEELLDPARIVNLANQNRHTAGLVRVGDRVVQADLKAIVEHLKPFLDRAGEPSGGMAGALGRRLAAGKDLLAELDTVAAASPEAKLAVAQLEATYVPADLARRR